MRMIRPVEIGKPELENSTAQAEGHPQWEAEGIPAITDDIVSSARFNGKALFSTSAGELYLYDHANNQQLTLVMSDQQHNWIDVSPDEQHMLSISSSVLSVFDTSDWSLVGQSSIDVRRAVFLSDNSSIAVVEVTSGIRAYEMHRVALGSLSSIQETIKGYPYTSGTEAYALAGVESISRGQNEDVFFAVSGGNDAPTYYCRWRPASGTTENQQPTNEVDVVACDPSSARLAITDGSDVRIFDQSDLSSATDTFSFSYSANEIQWSADGSLLFVRQSNSPQLTVVDVGTSSTEAASGISSDFFQDGTIYEQSLIAPVSGFAIIFSSVGQGIGVVDLSQSPPSLVEGVNPQFSEGDYVIFQDRIYQALTNTTDRPDNGANATPATWLDLGFINPLRIFDGSVGSQTTADGILEVTIAPGELVNGLALLNISGVTAQITMSDPTEGNVYDSGEISLIDNSSIQDWYSFFFEPYIEVTDISRTDIPPFPEASITITLDAQGSEASVGELVAGSIFDIGTTVYGTNVGIQDYSRKDQDEFGNFQITERGFANLVEYDFVVDPPRAVGVRRVLARFRATPAVYIGDDAFPETIVYGYYRDFDIILSNPGAYECTMTVEGLQQ